MTELALEPAPAVPVKTRKLLVLIPCLDEEKTVAQVVRGVPREIDGIDEVEVLVIDDGSTDETAQRALAAGASVFRHESTRGLGITFRDGLEQALERNAYIVVNIDGDGQFDPRDVVKVIAPVLAGDAEMATASRFMRRELIPKMPLVKRWGNGWVAGIVRLLTGRRYHDVSCGFRAFSRRAILSMNLFGSFTYTQETFLDLAFKGMRIAEVPVKVRGEREFGESRIASSIPLYALKSLQIMLRAFLGYRPFSFFLVIGLSFLTAGVGMLGFLAVHYVQSGAFSPHIWAGFVGGSFCFLGVLTIVLGFLGDMLVRLRLNQESVLYLLKRSSYER